MSHVSSKNIFSDEFYANQIHQIDLHKEHKHFCVARSRAFLVIGSGLANLVKTIVILPFRTLGCLCINPPIKVCRLFRFDTKKWKEFDNETTAFFSLKKVIQNAYRIFTLALGLLSSLVFGLFISPSLNIVIQTGLGHASAGALKSAPTWAEKEINEAKDERKHQLEQGQQQKEKIQKDEKELKEKVDSLESQNDEFKYKIKRLKDKIVKLANEKQIADNNELEQQEEIKRKIDEIERERKVEIDEIEKKNKENVKLENKEPFVEKPALDINNSPKNRTADNQNKLPNNFVDLPKEEQKSIFARWFKPVDS